MKLKRYGIRTVISIIALVTGLFVGTLGNASNNIFRNPSLEPAPVYNINEYGETYGSELSATTLETIPDLISAVGVDGTKGYVKKVDLYEEMPKTPEEALQRQRLRDDNTRRIPLYDVDGRTVIGQFIAGNDRVEVYYEY